MNWKKALLALLAAWLLSGCAIRTVDELYCPPKRSEDDNNLQSAMDSAMNGLSYCAPQAGENQQTVQMADLDGDGELEYLLFAKGSGEKPLEILIFHRDGEQYTLAQTIASYGSAFDQVEYTQIDHRPGVELVVGRKLSDQLPRSVSVYSFASGEEELLVTANYTKFLCCDLDGDDRSELFLLRPGSSESGKGVAELYGMEDGQLERFNEVSLSQPVDKLKRLILGKLQDGVPAVYAASAVEESGMITDVFALSQGVFVNASLSNTSGTGVQTLRSYYVYADDVDDDGVVELPDLITMRSVEDGQQAERQYLIRWYAMDLRGRETDKMFTYHNFLGGWYLELESRWASRVTVAQTGNAYAFCLWDEAGQAAEKIFTLFAFTGPDRESQALSENRFVLYKGDGVVYAASLEAASGTIALSQQALTDGFRLIQPDWKTGET